MQTAAPLAFYGQNQTVGPKAVQLTSTQTELNNGVTVKALSKNSLSVYVGDANVTIQNGFELTAGQEHLFRVIDARSLWFIAGPASSGSSGSSSSSLSSGNGGGNQGVCFEGT